MDKTSEAIAELQPMEQTNPKEPNLHFELGYLYYRQRDYDRSEKEFNLEIALDPNHAQAYTYLGDLAFQRNDEPGAEAMLDRAIQLQKGIRLAYLDLGVIYFDKKEYQKSITALKQAEQLDPSEPDAHYRLAQDYKAQGQMENAKLELAKTKALHSKKDEALLHAMSESNVAPQ